MNKKRGKFWKQQRVCVIGANGFVGSWVARALVERGAQVCALLHATRKNPSPILREAAPRIRLVRGDVLQYAFLKCFFARQRPNVVFHLAAQALVGHALKDPRETFEVNIRGGWNVLEALRRTQTFPRIVCASSIRAYDPPDPKTKAVSPYTVSRCVADEIAQMYARTYRLPVTIARFTNIYGGGDMHFDRLVPYSICAALRRESIVLKSHPRQQCRLLYIADAVDAYLRLAEQALQTGVRGNIFDFSAPRATTIEQILRQIYRLIRRQSPRPQYAINASRATDIHRSNRNAAVMLGWKPRYALRSGLAETVHWYRKYLHM